MKLREALDHIGIAELEKLCKSLSKIEDFTEGDEVLERMRLGDFWLEVFKNLMSRNRLIG